MGPMTRSDICRLYVTLASLYVVLVLVSAIDDASAGIFQTHRRSEEWLKGENSVGQSEEG